MHTNQRSGQMLVMMSILMRILITKHSWHFWGSKLELLMNFIYSPSLGFKWPVPLLRPVN